MAGKRGGGGKGKKSAGKKSATKKTTDSGHKKRGGDGTEDTGPRGKK
jgi:hypothetical protein